MSIHIDTRQARIVADQLRELNGQMKRDLKQAMQISLRDVQEWARAHHRFTTRTGETERSIEASPVQVTATGVSGEVGTTRLITIYLHEGTRPHTIVPRRKLALRWPTGSGFAFARRVQHPGTAEDPFIYDALEAEEPAIVSRFNHVIRNW